MQVVFYKYLLKVIWCKFSAEEAKVTETLAKEWEFLKAWSATPTQVERISLYLIS